MVRAVSLLAATLLVGCPEPDSFQSTQQRQAIAESLSLDSRPRDLSPAEQALARCEAAGDAYAETRAQHDAAVAEHGAAERAAAERSETDPRLVELRAQLREAWAEEDATAEAFDAIWDVAYRAAGKQWLRDNGIIRGRVHAGEAAEMAREYPEVKAARELRDAAGKAATTIQSEKWDREDELRAMAERETAELRTRIESLETRLKLDGELLGRAIQEANMLREPGGPTCSWQFE